MRRPWITRSGVLQAGWLLILVGLFVGGFVNPPERKTKNTVLPEVFSNGITYRQPNPKHKRAKSMAAIIRPGETKQADIVGQGSTALDSRYVGDMTDEGRALQTTYLRLIGGPNNFTLWYANEQGYTATQTGMVGVPSDSHPQGQFYNEPGTYNLRYYYNVRPNNTGQGGGPYWADYVDLAFTIGAPLVCDGPPEAPGGIAVKVTECNSVAVEGELPALPTCATSQTIQIRRGGDWNDEALPAVFEPGDYAARLMAHNVRDGVDYGSTPGPEAAFSIKGDLAMDVTAEPTTGTAPLHVNFTGFASGGTNPPEEVFWTFKAGGEGDGSEEISGGDAAEFDYTQPGTYTATARVKDENECEATDSVTITVTGDEETPVGGTPTDPPAWPPPGDGGGTPTPPDVVYPPGGGWPPPYNPTDPPPTTPPTEPPDDTIPPEDEVIGPASLPVLTRPLDLVAVGMAGLNRCTWGTIPDATQYIIYSALRGAMYAEIGRSALLTFDHLEAAPGVERFYLIRAHHEPTGALSPWSNEATATALVVPDEPSGPIIPTEPGGGCRPGYVLRDGQCYLVERPTEPGGGCVAPWVEHNGACVLPDVPPVGGQCSPPHVMGPDGVCHLPTLPPEGGVCTLPHVMGPDGQCYLPTVPTNPGGGCNAPYVERDGACVLPEVPPVDGGCTPPHVLVGGACVLPEVPTNPGGGCNAPYVEVDGQCVLIEYPPPPTGGCLPGYILINGQCQRLILPPNPDGTCNAPYVRRGDVCVIETLPPDEQGNCPPGYYNGGLACHIIPKDDDGIDLPPWQWPPDDGFYNPGDGNMEPDNGAHCCVDGMYYRQDLRACVPAVKPPNVPGAPVLKAHSNDGITIGSPAWEGTIERPVTGMEWRREEPGPDGAVVGAWDSATAEDEDEAVEPRKTYTYRARTTNAAGWSEWSAPLVVQLLSKTCHVEITEPLDGANLHRVRILQATCTDTGGATLQHFEANQIPLPAPIQVQGGAVEIWREVWHTREALQGATRVEFVALGSDNMYAVDAVDVVLDNTPENNIQYAEVGPLTTPNPATAYRNVYVGVEAPALSARPRFNWWALVGLRSWDLGGTDPLPNPPADEEEANTQFATHQRIDLRQGVPCPPQPGRRERRAALAVPRLKKAAQVVVARFQLHPQELPLGWSLLPSTRLIKAREAVEDELTHVFGVGTATVWEFDGVKPSNPIDLSTVGAGAATDMAVVDDKIYSVVNGQLWAVDTTPGDLPVTIILRLADGTPEPRRVRFVERVGEVLWVWCVDATRNPSTVVYAVRGADYAPMFAMDGAVNVVDVSPAGAVGMAVGRSLWRSSGTAEPTLAHQFPATITSMSQPRVGLTTGAVWLYEGEDWRQEFVITRGGNAAPVGALGEWHGTTPDTMRGMAVAMADVQMWEQGAPVGGVSSWGVGRLITNPATSGEPLTEVTSLRRFATMAPIPAEELTGGPGEATEREEERLLILTAPSGILIALNVSQLSEAVGAVAMSELSVATLAPGGAKQPLEVED